MGIPGGDVMGIPSCATARQWPRHVKSELNSDMYMCPGQNAFTTTPLACPGQNARQFVQSRSLTPFVIITAQPGNVHLPETGSILGGESVGETPKTPVGG
jgi:hypothetical protein